MTYNTKNDTHGKRKLDIFKIKNEKLSGKKKKQDTWI